MPTTNAFPKLTIGYLELLYNTSSGLVNHGRLTLEPGVLFTGTAYLEPFVDYYDPSIAWFAADKPFIPFAYAASYQAPIQAETLGEDCQNPANTMGLGDTHPYLRHVDLMVEGSPNGVSSISA